MTTDRASGAINLSELIHLDKVENILNSMMKRIDHQDYLIELLQTGSDSHITRATFERFGNDMTNVLNGHSDRLTAVEKDAHVLINDQVLSVSQVSLEQHNMLIDQQNQLDACVTKRQLAPKLQQMDNTLQREVSQLMLLCAKQSEVNKIENTQKELNHRMNNVEQSLTNKVNKSELSYIDSLVSRLEAYATFQDNTTDALRAIGVQISQIEENCRLFDQSISMLDAESRQLQEKAQSYASKADLKCLATEFLDLSALINQCASFDGLNSLNDSCRETNCLLQEVYQTVYEHDKALSVHSVELDLKANAATVQQDFVLRDHFDELFTTLGSSVDQKAQQTDVEVINSNVQDVIGQSNEISKQLAIALRFIEWFTSRGVNYEYNIGIIDKHLGGLADIGQKRKPFSNGIRYTAAVDSSDIDMSPITYPVAVEPTDTDTTTAAAAAAAATATSTTGGISAGTVDISTAESANTTLNNSIESV